MDRDDTTLEQPVADALRALKRAAAIPPADPARAATLFAAFDAAHATAAGAARRDPWYLGAFAAAAVLLLVVALPAVRGGGHASGILAPRAPLPSHDIQLGPPGDFVIVPGAAGLPPMESGTLVRMAVPVAMLPSLGVTPPPGQARTVTADFIVAQDGLARAVRVVSP